MRSSYCSFTGEKQYVRIPPPNYYEDSFRILHDAGMNHVRYTFYWEAYAVNPTAFMNELQMVAMPWINMELK